MDFLRNNEERAILDKVRQVAQKYIAPRVQASNEVEYVASENLAVLYRQGLMGLAVQEEYGGLGCNLRSNILVETMAVEEIACVCSMTSQWFHDHNEALGVIYKAGRKQVRAATCPWDEKPIEREPYSRWYIAEMSARVETVSHLLYTAAVALEKAQHRIDSRVEAAKAAYHAKVFATETALAVISHFLLVKKTSTTAERFDLDSYWRDTWSFILQDSAAYE